MQSGFRRKVLLEKSLRNIWLVGRTSIEMRKKEKSSRKTLFLTGKYSTHGYADRTALSGGHTQSALSHDLPSLGLRLAQVFGVEHERLANLRTLSLQLTLSVVGGGGLVIVHRHNVHLAPAVVLRPVFRPGVLVVEILKTGRQRFHHLVGSCGENRKGKYNIILCKQRLQWPMGRCTKNDRIGTLPERRGGGVHDDDDDTPSRMRGDRCGRGRRAMKI